MKLEINGGVDVEAYNFVYSLEIIIDGYINCWHEKVMLFQIIIYVHL